MGTYLLDLLLRDLLNGLGDLANLVGLGTVDQARAGSLEAGLESLDGLQSAELGQSSGLLDVLAGDLTGGGLLERIDDVLAGGTNLLSLAGQGDGEQTGIGVGQVLGGHVELVEALGGLGQERETGSPLDGGLAAEQGSEDGSLGLVASGAKGAGAGEGNHNGVADLGGDALLTTEVLAGGGGLDLVLAVGGAGGEVLEELARPLADIGGVGAGSNKSNVGLGVGILGVLSKSIGREVLLIGRRRGGGNGGAQATVESDTVGGIKSNVLGVGESGLLVVLEEVADNLVQFVV